MAVFSRGFGARRRESDPRLPPGQYLTEDFPVLSAGPTPQIDTDEWTFAIRTEAGDAHDRGRGTSSWRCRSKTSRPTSTASRDGRSSARRWRGVSIDTLLDLVETDADYAMAHSYGGYTTNVPMEDLRGGKAWVAFEFDGEPLDPEHGGPARLLVPHLYFWKSAKWVRGLTLMDDDAPGFWEQNGYNMHGDPWTEERYW